MPKYNSNTEHSKQDTSKGTITNQYAPGMEDIGFGEGEGEFAGMPYCLCSTPSTCCIISNSRYVHADSSPSGTYDLPL